MGKDICVLYCNLVATEMRCVLLTRLLGGDVCEVVLAYLPAFNEVRDGRDLSEFCDEEDADAHGVHQFNREEQWLSMDDDEEVVREDIETEEEAKEENLNICLT